MRNAYTRAQWFITLVERAGDIIIAIHVRRIDASEQVVARLDSVTSKAIIADGVVRCIQTRARLIVARIVGARNAVVTIHGHAINAIGAIASFGAIAGIAVVAFGIHRATCGGDATKRWTAIFGNVAKCRV